MAQKYYAILESANGKDFTFPIKAPINEYNRTTVQYAGGNPAIFGGTSTGTNVQTVRDETSEESRTTLAVDGGAALTQIVQTTVGANTLTFYYTPNWKATGNPWGKPTSFSTGEMLGVVTLAYADFQGHTGSDKDILDRLIKLSGAPGGTAQQNADFMSSETAVAFVTQIRKRAPLPGARRA